MATSQNLTIMRGNTQNVTLTISPISIDSGDIIYFTVKEDYDNDQTDNGAVIHKDITGKSGHSFTIEITPEDTNDVVAGNYVYDIKLAKPNSQTTLVYGKFKVMDAVTLRGGLK